VLKDPAATAVSTMSDKAVSAMLREVMADKGRPA
jgi:hypothetical protein